MLTSSPNLQCSKLQQPATVLQQHMLCHNSSAHPLLLDTQQASKWTHKVFKAVMALHVGGRVPLKPLLPRNLRMNSATLLSYTAHLCHNSPPCKAAWHSNLPMLLSSTAQCCQSTSGVRYRHDSLHSMNSLLLPWHLQEPRSCLNG